MADVGVLQQLLKPCYILRETAFSVFPNGWKPFLFAGFVAHVLAEIPKRLRHLLSLKTRGLGQFYVGCKASLLQQFSDPGCGILPGEDLCGEGIPNGSASRDMQSDLVSPGRYAPVVGLEAVTVVIDSLHEGCQLGKGLLFHKLVHDLQAGLLGVAAQPQKVVYILLGQRKSEGRSLCALRFYDGLDLFRLRGEHTELCPGRGVKKV